MHALPMHLSWTPVHQAYMGLCKDILKACSLEFRGKLKRGKE
jgi:hypothetical protein